LRGPITRLAWIREGCVSSNLAHMLRDPFIRFQLDQAGRWQMKPPGPEIAHAPADAATDDT
jgi:hypothetical protein